MINVKTICSDCYLVYSPNLAKKDYVMWGKDAPFQNIGERELLLTHDNYDLFYDIAYDP